MYLGLSRVLTFPLDTIKTLEQTEESERQGVMKGTVLSETDTNHMESPRGEGKLDLSSLGWTDYLRGLGPTIFAAIPANAVFFIVYNYLDAITNCYMTPLDLTSPQLVLWKRLVIALIATLPQNAIKIPAEVVKQRSQIQDSANSWEIFNDIKDNEGFQGFYAGSIGMLLREIPFNSFQMAFFASLKDVVDLQQAFFSIAKLSFLRDSALLRGVGSGFDDIMTSTTISPGNDSFGSFESALLGLIASFLAAVLTQPADVLKTKLMVANTTNPLTQWPHCI